jgi:FAD/FMN-containing dehydrogenase
MPALLTDPRLLAAYSEGAGIYRIVPRAVATPTNSSEIADVLRQAADQHVPVIPRGAGSGMAGGNVGRGVVLDLSLGFRALEIDSRRRVARAGASVTWAQVNEAARGHGLRLPPDPSSGAFATSGGMASTNAAGPRSVRYGSVRPWIEALEITGADGEIRWVRRGARALKDTGGERFHLDPEAVRCVSQAFPKTRKNSSGYALDAFAASGDEVDLFIGAEGTLGVVTAVDWRLDPIPPDAGGVALGFADLEALGEAVPFLLNLGPSAIELLDHTLLAFVNRAGGEIPEAVECLLLVEFERPTAPAARGVVGDAVRGLKHLLIHAETAVDRSGLDQLWGIRRLASPALAQLPEQQRSLQVIEDGCVPIERLARYVMEVRFLAGQYEIPLALFGHAGDGHVHVNVLPDLGRPGWRQRLQGLYDDVSGLLKRLGGTPSGEHGDGRLRAGLLNSFFGRDVVDQFRRLKHAYDPEALLNPGVILPATDWAPLTDLKVGEEAAPIPDDIAARLRDLERNATWATPKQEMARGA